MKILVMIVEGLALIGGTIGCGQSVTPSACYVRSDSNVTVHSFGDSITVGGGASNSCNGYVPLFDRMINATSDNEGISGSPLTDEMSVILGDWSSKQQDISTLLPGFNDVRLYGSDPTHLAEFEQALTLAIQTLANKTRLVLVGTTLYATLLMQQTQIPNQTNANVDLYVNVIKQVISSLSYPNVVLVDTNAIYNPDTMSDNNFHPDDTGHEAIAQAFYQQYLLYSN